MKNIISKVLSPFAKVDINQQLADIMYNKDQGMYKCTSFPNLSHTKCELPEICHMANTSSNFVLVSQIT